MWVIFASTSVVGLKYELIFVHDQQAVGDVELACGDCVGVLQDAVLVDVAIGESSDWDAVLHVGR